MLLEALSQAAVGSAFCLHLPNEVRTGGRITPLQGAIGIWDKTPSKMHAPRVLFVTTSVPGLIHLETK